MSTQKLSPPIITHSQQVSKQSDNLESLQQFIDIGRLSASLIHEISGPLTAALLQLETSPYIDSPNIRQAKRSLRQLESYITAARNQLSRADIEQTMFCTHAQLHHIKKLVMPLAKAKGIELIIDTFPHYQLKGDPVKFQQILVNVIMNAIDAYDSSPSAEFVKPVRVICETDQNSISISVADWGVGIPNQDLAKIFEPFYSTKGSASRGLGIGLTIVKQHMQEDFNGSIEVASSSRLGTRFQLYFPATPYPRSHFRRK